MRRCLLLIISILLLAPALALAQTDQQTLDDIIKIKIPGIEDLSKVSKNATSIPFLAEYIAGLYRYGVYAATIIAAFMLTISGFQYAASAGNTSAIKAARQRAVNAVLALAILYSSYIILYALNPQLTTIQSLSVKSVKEIQASLGTEDGVIQDNNPESRNATTTDYSQITTICFKERENTADPKKSPTCKQWCIDNSDKTKWPTKSKQVVDPSTLVQITDLKGVTFTNVDGSALSTEQRFVTQSYLDALKLAGNSAEKQKNVLIISGGYRPLQRQISLVCDDLASHEAGKIANPGTSNHGKGTALDIKLGQYDASNKLVALTCAGVSTCKSGTPGYDHDNAKALLDLMTTAGFKREKGEIWHFEYGTNGGNLCSGSTCPLP